MKRIIALSLLMCLLLQARCVMNLTGGSSNSENCKVAGIIIDTAGTRQAGAGVFLIPEAYDPLQDDFSSVKTTVTDSNGEYEISAIAAGGYNLQVFLSTNGTRLLIRGLAITSDSTALKNGILRKPGAIKIMLPDGLDETNGYLYIPGTTIYSWLIDNNGYVMLKAVPACVNLSVYYAVWGSAAKQPQMIADSVTVTPGGITNIEYAGWGFSKKFILNTTATGANVAGNVVNFPVLVRLTGGNFNFSQAKGGGEDIRFAKSDGLPLPYEIERWDSANAQAEIWVKVDTIFGNDSSHCFTMYWGNLKVSAVSNSAVVFDTSNGFEGVWHLQETSGDVSDATINQNTGVNSGTLSITGVIDKGRAFDSSRINLGSSTTLCGLTDSMTVSGWLNSTQVPATVNISIVRNNAHFTALQVMPNGDVDFNYWSGVTSYNTISVPWNGNFNDGTWHYFTVEYKTGKGAAFYKDGVLVGKDTVNTRSLVPTATSFYLGGTESANEYFKGALDEIRVEKAFRSSDWVKLCFMNQEADDRLIVLK
jgi:hypothetical protein